jgi:hypothetical protein
VGDTEPDNAQRQAGAAFNEMGKQVEFIMGRHSFLFLGLDDQQHRSSYNSLPYSERYGWLSI